MPQITTDDGCAINFYVWGSGPPLVLLPGLEEPATNWGPILPMLTQHFTCISIDQRGTGFSGRPTKLWSSRRMAKDAAQVLDSLKIDKADVLGFSLGGIVAQEFAYHHPERTKKLVLVSTSPVIVSIPPPPQFFIEKFRVKLGEVPFLRRIGIGSVRRLIHPHVVEPPPPDGIRELLSAITHVGSLELRRLRVPTLIIHGTVDDVISVKNARLMNRWVRGSKLELIPGEDHGALYHQPRRVADLIRGFIT